MLGSFRKASPRLHTSTQPTLFLFLRLNGNRIESCSRSLLTIKHSQTIGNDQKYRYTSSQQNQNINKVGEN